jgi:hypothetical protein
VAFSDKVEDRADEGQVQVIAECVEVLKSGI